MISQEALDDFMEIWNKEIGTPISPEKALEQAIQMLVLFGAVYKPLCKQWEGKNENENANKDLQKTNLQE